MPVGKSSVPDVFQRKMNGLIEGLSGIEVIADDFGVVTCFSYVGSWSYVGRTSQRLEERVKQSIPASLVKAAESQKAEPKRGKKKRKKKKKKKTTENQGRASAEVAKPEKNVTLTTEQGHDSASENDANQQVLKVAKSDSGITPHLKTSSKCRDVVCQSSVTSWFKVAQN